MQRETGYAAQAPRITTHMKRTILFVLVLLTSLTSVPAQQDTPKRPLSVAVIAPSVSTSMESAPAPPRPGNPCRRENSLREQRAALKTNR
jgi:hypothetical protein